MGEYGVSYGTAEDYGSATEHGATEHGATGYGATGYGGAAATGPVVSFENVSKHYGSLKAVDGLSLEVRPGGRHVAVRRPDAGGDRKRADNSGDRVPSE